MAKFYQELMTVLKNVNRRNPEEGQISFTKAVTEGLGLKHTFTTKITAGTYRPTLDRLVSLGNFLGVHPATFTDFVERFSDEVLIRDSNDFRETLRVLATMPTDVRDGYLERFRESVKSWRIEQVA